MAELKTLSQGIFWPVSEGVAAEMLIRDNILSFPKSGDVFVLAPIAGNLRIKDSGAKAVTDVSILSEVGGKVFLNALQNLLKTSLTVADNADVVAGQVLGKTSAQLLGINEPLQWRSALVLKGDPQSGKDFTTEAINPLELGGLLGGLFFAQLDANALDIAVAQKSGFFESFGRTAFTFLAGGLVGGAIGAGLAKK